MPARPKLTRSRRQRLFAILALGESFEAAARAIGVSTNAIRERAAREPIFAAELQAARARVPRDPLAAHVDPLAPDWMQAALMLESEYPERWGLPVDPAA